MKTIKSFTSLEQSKILAEILPVESADMHYARVIDDFEAFEWTPLLSPIPKVCATYVENIPCWSLAALLEIIRNNGRYELQMWEGGYCFEANGFMTESYFNPIDACYEMIIKLHKSNML